MSFWGQEEDARLLSQLDARHQLLHPGAQLGVSERAVHQARAQHKHFEVLSFQGPRPWDVDGLGVVQESWNHSHLGWKRPLKSSSPTQASQSRGSSLPHPVLLNALPSGTLGSAPVGQEAWHVVPTATRRMLW